MVKPKIILICTAPFQLLFVSTILFSFFVSIQAQANSITAFDARVSGDVFRTRLIVDLSGKVNFRTFTLSNPNRLVLDMADVDFQMPPKTGTKGRGLISAFRYGLFAPGKSRVVIDLSRAAEVEKSYSIKPNGGQPGKLVIDLIPIDEQTFLNKQQIERQKRLAEAEKLRKKSAPGLDPFLSNQPQGKKKKFVIVIDPGHGGIDPGATGVAGSKEKNIVLAFSRAFYENLSRNPKYTVYMTRRTDVFIPLKRRVEYARRRQADLFVSIHADSIKRKDPKVRGASIYTLSEKASDAEAQALAKSENSSDILAGVDLPSHSSVVTNILFDLAKRETQNHSIAFANILVTSLRGTTIVKQNPIRSANFVVLRAPDIPSVLVELGYLSSKNDEKLLKSASWRKKVAKSMANAINSYFDKRSLPNPF